MAALDHVALEVPDLDAFVTDVERAGLLRVLRRGVRGGTGQRLVMLVDDRGQKLEIIEGGELRVLHVAFEVDDVESAHQALVADGYAGIRSPHRIPAAAATSSVVRGASGAEVQLVRYDADSPDRTH